MADQRRLLKDLECELDWPRQDCQYFNKLVSKGQKNLSLVTNCMEHALTTVQPRTHYSAGWDAKCFSPSVLFTDTSGRLSSSSSNSVRPADAV
ncbi:17-beta-hydroxysteroid dehydrogenase type 6 [Camelus dromedarius]|uniref:17-beta-hydroxysteroid dehydrogenase type 6 n=1 Tax=Camelus dromedarius TaxID=9838 RepID=A0A5N4DHL1_CAMDR|nr:17-beta-hydroxysteroid dehydrogenase type 6 [Camelus dromedarius]